MTAPRFKPMNYPRRNNLANFISNGAEIEIAAAAFFWDKLASCAVVILDDNGWEGDIVQKRAFDQFARDRGIQVLPLPTGPGLLFKP